LDYLYPKTQAWQPRANKQIAVFMGHEASLTGAPMVLLNLVKRFADWGFECFTVLKRGGPLLSEYAQYSHVLNMANCEDVEAVVSSYLSSLATISEPYRFIGTIVNSLESIDLARPLEDFAAPVIYLVHELSDGYSQEWIQEVAEVADQLVFSSNYTKESFQEKCMLPVDKPLVIPQGLLDSNFGTGNREAARKSLREELGLPESAFLVISCGMYHLRKGTDWFVDVARKTLENCVRKDDVHFVWLGHGEDHSFTLFYYCKWDLRQYQIERNVHFIGERTNLNDYFLGADVFLMMSRQDPFPCVAQNAMAAGLPVIAFDGTGGVPELLARGGGNILPYGDTSAVAELVLDYYNDPDKICAVGSVGRQVINRHYRFDQYFSKLRELLLSNATAEKVNC
jgi:glycosyltransferase involved in cell wall biosynthesis